MSALLIVGFFILMCECASVHMNSMICLISIFNHLNGTSNGDHSRLDVNFHFNFELNFMCYKIVVIVHIV